MLELYNLLIYCINACNVLYKVIIIKKLFNTFQKSFKVFMHSIFSVRLSVYALTYANLPRFLCNLYMLLMLTIACLVTYVKCVALLVHLQGHAKISSTLWFMGKNR